MYRRITPVTAAAASAGLSQMRCISEYKFGQLPLTDPWGVAKRSVPTTVASANAPVNQIKVKITQLHNGARVITQNRDGAMVSVGAYILAGPAYDPVGCPGVHHLLHLALTTSNYNNSLFQLDRSIRSTGAAFSHFEKDKHYIGLRLDARADMWKSLNKRSDDHFKLNLVQDTIFTAISAPRFHESDIERFRDTIDNNLKELRWQHPAQYAIQQLETIAFYKEPLGNPRHVPEKNNGNITSKVLLDHYAQYVTPDRVVIAGVNVDHGELIAEYENTPYPHSTTAPHHAAFEKQKTTPAMDINSEKRQYTGGEKHEHENRPKEMCTKPDMNTETIVAVGYLSFGRNRAYTKRYAASLVFQQLFNITIQDGMRYERGGMCDGVRSFYLPYQSAGLMGFTAAGEPGSIVKMVTAAMRDMQAIKVDDNAAMEIAKHRAAVETSSQNWDTIRDLCDYMGTSLSIVEGSQQSTQYTTPEEVLEAIRAVTPAELREVKEFAMSSKPSLFGHGEMMSFPSLRQLGF